MCKVLVREVDRASHTIVKSLKCLYAEHMTVKKGREKKRGKGRLELRRVIK